MNKKIRILIANIVLIGIAITSGCTNNKDQVKSVDNTTSNVNATANSQSDKNNIKYKDGAYEVTTEPTGEGFICKAKVTIKNSKITNVEWNIYDKDGRVFDAKYEDVYSEAEYKQQCRDDLKGSKNYGAKLVETQDPEKVDAVTGATWTNNIFKNAVEQALKQAE